MADCFGIISTLVLFFIYEKFKTKNIYLKKVPAIVAVGGILIFIIKIFDIDYEIYHKSASLLSWLIAPATVAFAYPMYKNSHILTSNKRALYPSIIIGLVSAFISTLLCTKIFGVNLEVAMSLMPKSITLPIAVEISKTLGGYSELTACMVAITGIFGAVFGHRLLKLFKVKNDTAIGLAIGCASHIIGTASCAERKNSQQTAAGTIALISMGILSAVFIPLLKPAMIAFYCKFL